MSGEIGNILRECKYEAMNLEEYQKSAIDNLALHIDENPALLEAFSVGLFCNDPLTLPFELKNILEKKCIETVTQREWYKFNVNILTLLDVSSFPNDIKESCKDYAQLLDFVDQYAPEFYYPKVHQQKQLLQSLDIKCLDDVIVFNHQFKKIFGYLIDNFIGSNLFNKFTIVDAAGQYNKLNAYQKKYKLASTNKIYKSFYHNKKLVSLDVKQANATFLFLYYGLELFENLEDMGLNFEKIFSSKQDMENNFNWSAYVKISLDKCSNDKIIVSKKYYDTLCKVFENSKMTREIIVGVMTKKKPEGASANIASLYESACKTFMFDLLDSMQVILREANANVISLSTDEIIIEGLSTEVIFQHMNSKPIGNKSFIAEKYLHIEEFILKQHTLANGKNFYVKYHTNGSTPRLYSIDPVNKIEVFDIVNKQLFADIALQINLAN